MAILVLITISYRKRFPKMRGRPRLFDEKKFRETMRINPHVTTRTAQNVHYYIRGINFLGAWSLQVPGRWSWLLRPSSGQTYPRKSIVSQLGRVRCPIAIKTFAGRLCELKPTARDAITALRRWEKLRVRMLGSRTHGGLPPSESLLTKLARRACVAGVKSAKSR